MSKSQKDYRKNYQQLIKVSGRTTFVEVMNNAFNIGKVLFNFVQYDDTKKQGSRVVAQIPIYMDIDKALVLIQDIKSGLISGLAKREKDSGNKYPKYVFKHQGGTTADALAARGKARKDNACEARQITITPGAKVAFILEAQVGRGEEGPTGLIIMKNKERNIMVPFSAEDLKRLALVLELHLNAYTALKYQDGTYLQNPFANTGDTQQQLG